MQGSPNAITQAGNLFMFVMHNPVRWVDPTGLFAGDPNRHIPECTRESDRMQRLIDSHVPSGWGAVSNFINDLSVFLGPATHTYTDRNSVIVQAGSGSSTVTGEFFFDGRIVVPGPGVSGVRSTIERAGINRNGRLYMYRTDFYRAMGIEFYQRVFYISHSGIARYVASLTVGLGIAYATAALTTGQGYFIGAAAGLFFDHHLNFFPEAGDTMLIDTRAFIWNHDLGRHHVIWTEERLLWSNIDHRGNQGWVVPHSGPHTRIAFL